MKTLNTVLAIVVWACGFIVGLVVLGRAGFLLMLVYWLAAFIAGCIPFTLAKILEQLEELRAEQGRSSANFIELRRQLEKSEKTAGTAPSQPTAQYPTLLRQTDGGWKCKSCGLENSRAAVYCRNCGTYR